MDHVLALISDRLGEPLSNCAGSSCPATMTERSGEYDKQQ